jgi:gliding motility-associated-like protein
MKLKISTLSALMLISIYSSYAQLSVTTGQTAATLANALNGGGVTILNPVLTCPSAANGTFSYTGSTLNINNGILLTTGHAAAAAGAEPPLVNFNNSAPGDPAMAPYLPPGANTYDACILEFDLIPSGDTIAFNYQFGSEEYIQAVCSDFTDVFAFFISGPGIGGTDNMALVPGTNIPVEINSINNGTPGTVPSANISNCTSLGPGSPFTSFFVDNTGGSDMAYRGYTTKLKAFHTVTPCQQYHLKLSIVDAGNWQYDSGVFLEKGSLTSNAFRFSVTDSIGHTINGTPHTIVKGCSPATVTIVADHVSTTPGTVNLTYSGTAVENVDVSILPASLILPAGSTTLSFDVQGLVTTANGPVTLDIHIQTPCGNSDNLTLTILDTPTAKILTPDTSVCAGQSFTIRTSGTAGISYNWTPAATLNSATAAQPMATPLIATTYTLSAGYPNVGCPLLVRTVNVGMTVFDAGTIAGDSTFCTGTYYTFTLKDAGINDIFWSFGNGDTVTGKQSVLHAWSAPGTFYVTAGPVFSGCGLPAIKEIRVYPSPFINLGADTTICPGNNTISLHDIYGGAPATAQWLWNNSATTNTISVDAPGQYYATVTANGCTASDSINIEPDCFTAVPNVFTPNGDGVNDYFYPRQALSAGLTKFHMTLYNRWGQVIFETKSLDGSGWDGRFNGELQPAGVFVYTIDATFKDGSELKQNGNVTLLR